MKRSKIVSIGLLALSLASCHQRRHNHGAYGSWNDAPNSYVSGGDQGYYQPCSPGVPFWFYYYMMYRPGYGVYSTSGVAYSSWSNGRSSGWHVSEGGHIGRASIGRGGFGSSGHGAGS